MMNQKIPEYLNEKENLIRLIVYTALFALVFINIYQPFGSRNWFPVSEIIFFVFSSLVILTGVLVVVISRIIMYRYTRKHDLLLWQYIIWVVAEIVAMALFYSLFGSIILNDARPLREIMRQSVINTSLVLLLPYATIWLYLSWKDKNKKLENLIQDDSKPEKQSDQVYNFFDEKKELKLSVKADQVIRIDSADNYVKVHFLNKGKITSFMIRNTLLSIENDFANTTLIRCNRSVIVNFDKVKVLRKEQDGIYLSLDLASVQDIPVTKKYAGRVLSRFSNYSA
ncbi:MAG: LytTR family transcriptional regulator [Bacteroidales bacterium]|nr:LytTR family transcriptional regulator [Bacteroidales bacterium]